MKFLPEFLDEIRARLPVSEVVAKRVKLRKAGAGMGGPVAVHLGEDALVLRQ